ncbi:hypothetical protein FRX31_024415 [Thalictrum thalictroides]|uniref:Uncharacterized protein n=1 Tax=Thalictrum thalictroides TaxID=46969 RepID=A0A7J6VML6_THATH|nr:hypothetical protein FRX31_024415 [Thalictrum thalictroides]
MWSYTGASFDYSRPLAIHIGFLFSTNFLHACLLRELLWSLEVMMTLLTFDFQVVIFYSGTIPTVQDLLLQLYSTPTTYWNTGTCCLVMIELINGICIWTDCSVSDVYYFI